MSKPRISPSTKERLITVAVDAFGREGFDVGIRTITTRATAAAGIVQYHFGGKEGLREACDQRVYMAVDAALPAHFRSDGMVQIAEDGDPSPIVYYVLRSLGEGAPLARQVVSRLATHVAGLLGPAEKLGSDTLNRARQVVRFALGATMLDFSVRRPQGPDEVREFIRVAWDEEFVPLIARVLAEPDLLGEPATEETH
ncbi:TetR family transcriptional regulator [Ruania alkalisoli]|uniref:TetR family transcriptional regulator n=1 Tax=Ruania alkalisoli TaxID=2779775 RepID=A0A7M1SRH5_9MICO|nr:TetR family transcriptional regulator [Ruania alkalisoli]QOR69737.1 TetR family transcriptional regulator [Ruania alkalisoli]